ncbi:carbohydrate ABC transporter ATP-binding protein, CUT1 family (TC 3.A.1.1.-) [Vreelandella subterranea]|uniref:Carbohydrate ABC transporter ATP-binding protein, CUT1 family (TC 3.A.1.1.-) n=1 Tax=Vreelandella subterranea TaxID=416874 RepID=A0A1H9W6P8_9GAMM|nr:ABC transporter ATP-binding protein [Halomonas subterranea]SES29357.1 carbohydrate ABC transporter ATP-binding protein, CUT1 family (TC 3.A.1.1.-) [Halomonas subterranea]
MAEIVLKTLAHTYSANPQSAKDYAIRHMEHVWHQGGAYALLGPSGCGKSTLLNIISGLLAPTEGDVLFDGQRVNELPPEERNIAQVFQFPVIYDTMTVFDNLAFPLRNMNTPEYRVKPKVLEVADILELTPLLSRKAKNLTADEKQKVSMGRGLVRDDVTAILFDEPLTVIDPQLKWKLRRKLKEIHERFNITMIYVTHDQLEASTFADKIAVMYEGQVVQFGTPRELFETPAHTFVGYFIGSPGMNFFELRYDQAQNTAYFGDQSLPLSNAYLATLKKAESDNLKLGIRPEFIEVHSSHEPDTIAVQKENLQDLGTYAILTFSLNQQTFKARLPEDHPDLGDTVYIRFPDDKLSLYVDEYRVEVDHE